jgi:hypothetical protein
LNKTTCYITLIYNEDPRPEYAPKTNKVNKPRAASPPTVATIQSGTRPASLILTISLKYYFNNLIKFKLT